MVNALRELERDSIREFVASCADLLTGRVLDYGAGLSPYRDLVAGEYVAYDHRALPGFVSGGPSCDSDPLGLQRFDAILCTQVIQYVPHPKWFLEELAEGLKPGGVIVMTGPTNWPVVENVDLWRFTPAGVRELVDEARLRVRRLEERASFPSPGGPFLLGWGLVAAP